MGLCGINMSKIVVILNYVWSMGFRWLLFRIKYEYRKRTRYFDKKNEEVINKSEVAVRKYERMDTWGLTNPNYSGEKHKIEEADKAIEGYLKTFSHRYFNYNVNGKLNWHFNPDSKSCSPNNLSWNRLPDFGDFGDIKLIWEASRFPQVFAFIDSYAVTKDEKYARACIEQIIDWCKKNPFPLGVNYKCGQEISLRLIVWIIALDYFNDFFSESEKKIIFKNICSSLYRIRANIEYAIKSVKNNHSVCECVGLILGGLFFPNIPQSKEMMNFAHKELVKELEYQVYSDGSYIQNSFIYQRLALDVLSFLILSSNKLHFKLDSNILKKHHEMTKFLISFIQEKGHLPNYGSNDGANLFPIGISSYRSFDMSLNFALSVNKQVNLTYKDSNLLELFNIDVEDKFELSSQLQYRAGGYYNLTNKDFFLFTRIHSHYHRPAQADMLHLDVWFRGRNIFCDSGTFSYNKKNSSIPSTLKDTFAHNTILINGMGQMNKVGKFGWSNWTQSKLIKISEKEIVGEHYGFKKRFGVIHRRSIYLDEKEVLITDTILGNTKDLLIEQLWTTMENVQRINKNDFSIGELTLCSNLENKVEEAKISNFYNDYEKGTRIIYSKKGSKNLKLETKIKIGI